MFFPLALGAMLLTFPSVQAATANASTNKASAVPDTNANLNATMTALFGNPVVAKGRGFEIRQGDLDEVMTGISLRTPAAEIGLVDTTSVRFHALTETEIAWYVASGEGRDKAGAYAIQGLGSRFIPWIEGAYSNVVGLPVAALNDLLKALGSGYPVG